MERAWLLLLLLSEAAAFSPSIPLEIFAGASCSASTQLCMQNTGVIRRSALFAAFAANCVFYVQPSAAFDFDR